MVDDDVRLRIKINGGLMAERMLYRTLDDEGVRIVSFTSSNDVETRSDWPSVASATMNYGADAVIIVTGGVAAVKAALRKFRQHQPQSRVEVQDDESGKRLEGYL